MKKWMIVIILAITLFVPVNAQELTPPKPPDDAAALLPAEQNSFAEGLWHVIRSAVELVLPDLAQASGVCFAVIGGVMLISLLENMEGRSKLAVKLTGIVVIGCLLFQPANILINLGADTVEQICSYEKLFLPVMTAALAAQGGTATSSALYVTTAGVNAVLSSLIVQVLIPCVYLYLALTVMDCLTDFFMLKKMRKAMMTGVGWGMKLLLSAFIGFVSITGVVSGTADQAALKATKLTISTMVPMIGSMLSDASETVLLGAAMVKNAAGIYGILALLAITAVPFLKIGLQYLLLKLTASICSMLAGKQFSDLVEGFSSAMGMILAMTGTICVIFLISIVCFLKGMG